MGNHDFQVSHSSDLRPRHGPWLLFRDHGDPSGTKWVEKEHSVHKIAFCRLNTLISLQKLILTPATLQGRWILWNSSCNPQTQASQTKWRTNKAELYHTCAFLIIKLHSEVYPSRLCQIRSPCQSHPWIPWGWNTSSFEFGAQFAYLKILSMNLDEIWSKMEVTYWTCPNGMKSGIR